MPQGTVSIAPPGRGQAQLRAIMAQSVYMVHTFTWTNMPLAATVFGGASFQIKALVDLRGMTQYRILAGMRAAGAAGADLDVEYSTDDATYNDMELSGTGGEVAIGSAAFNVGAWTDMAVAAQANEIYLRIIGKDGDGVVDPTFDIVIIQFRNTA